MDNLKDNLSPIEQNSECIILLHGLARTHRCMNKAARIFSSYGYHVINVSYPSRRKTIEQLAIEAIKPAIEEAEQKHCRRIHFLTHSMGGILLRYYLSKKTIKNLGRTVMLAPPNRGSEIVDKIGHWKLFYLCNGPAGLQLGTDQNSIPRQLGKLDFETGIITGNKSWNPLLSGLISDANDGKVSVSSARQEGMKDFLPLPYSHSFIMQHKSVIEQALYFIQQGYFDHKKVFGNDAIKNN